jgi:predicted nucleic acid-binding protein
MADPAYVFLDQNHWIYLAKDFWGKPHQEKHRGVAKRLLAKVERDEVRFAPTLLQAEIEEHLGDIANETRVDIEDVRREWLDFRKLLHFYSPKQQPLLHEAEIVDADDLPYIAAANELGLPIYSQDRHYRQMQAPVISVSD